jgi:8-hydroxy-5-deazaflavin:NADPH oxidoreductase
MNIALIGGTGKEGSGLAVRWARAGHRILIGSRDAGRARAKAAEYVAAGHGTVEGGDNAWAARASDVAVIAVPYAAHRETLRGLQEALAGRIVVDITVPLAPPRVSQVHVPPGHAAALEAQAILGPATPVVAALHHISSVHLADPAHAIECDVLFATSDERARATMEALISDLGLRAVDAGALANAVALESLTPVLIHLNKKYQCAGTGIRITGLPQR